MSRPNRNSDAYRELYRDLTRSIIIGTGTREQLAVKYADAVMECLQRRKAANGNIYVGTPPRQYDVLQIRAALEAGASVRVVCRQFGLGRRTLYRLFPGGLPEPKTGN